MSDLGRSSGGFTSELHIRGNAHGLPIAQRLDDGQDPDCLNYDTLMETGDSDPANMLNASSPVIQTACFAEIMASMPALTSYNPLI
jgi:hypothetical protein